MLLYHVGRAKGKEPPRANNQYGEVVESTKKREEKVGEKIEWTHQVKDGGK